MSIVLVSLFWQNNILLTALLLIIATVLLLTLKTKEHLIIFILAGFSGAGAEAIAIYFGAWTYSNPNIYVLPTWLILLWGIASLTILKLFNSLSNVLKLQKPIK